MLDIGKVLRSKLKNLLARGRVQQYFQAGSVGGLKENECYLPLDLPMNALRYGRNQEQSRLCDRERATCRSMAMNNTGAPMGNHATLGGEGFVAW